MKNPSVLKVAEYIKFLLKKEAKTQKDLAEHLSISLPAVKKMLSNNDFSLDRICRISEYFGLEMPEFIRFSQETIFDPQTLSNTQEKFLAEDYTRWMVMILSIQFSQLSDIQAELKLERAQLEEILIGLDNHGLIKFGPEGKIKFNLSWPFDLNHRGPIARTYFKDFIHLTVEKVGQEKNYLEYNNNASSALFRFESRCHPKTIQTFFSDMNKSVRDFFENSRKDKFIYDDKDLKYYSFGAVLGEFSIWKELYLQKQKE